MEKKTEKEEFEECQKEHERYKGESKPLLLSPPPFNQDEDCFGYPV